MRKFFTILMGAFLALIFVCPLDAQMRRDNNRVMPYSEDEAATRWRDFSNSRIAGDYCMEFKITHNPRKGESVIYLGEIFGAGFNDTTFTRIRIKKLGEDKMSDFILSRSNKESKVWKLENNKFQEVKPASWLEPMVDGLIYSPFDLLMPYVFWDSKYMGAGRIGQAVHFYALTAPKDFSEKVSYVKIALTREFNSPAQIETFTKEGMGLKTVTLGAVKKVDGLWIMLEAEARDEVSRDKDKLRFTAAKLDIFLDPKIFSTDDVVVEPKKPELNAL